MTRHALGHAERLAALALIEPHAERPQPVALGTDKGYDAGEFVMELRDKAVTPHVAQNTSARRSAIDGRTRRTMPRQARKPCSGCGRRSRITRASGHAERLAALTLIEPHAERPQPVTLGADKGYDVGEFVMELRDKAVTPHVAQNTSARRSAIDRRTTRHPGYAISQRIRKRVEEAFGWAKTVAGLRKMRHRGLPKVDWQFTLAMAAYDLVRLPKLLA